MFFIIFISVLILLLWGFIYYKVFLKFRELFYKPSISNENITQHYLEVDYLQKYFKLVEPDEESQTSKQKEPTHKPLQKSPSKKVKKKKPIHENMSKEDLQKAMIISQIFDKNYPNKW